MSLVIVSCGLFSLGLYGVLTRRDLVAILVAIEVMLGGAMLLLVGLGSLARGGIGRTGAGVEGIALLVLVVAAAEAAVGLALVVVIARRSGRTRIDELTEVEG